MNYNEFKLTIFNIIANSSRSIIVWYLRILSTQYAIPYNDVVNDFNEYSGYMWKITCE